MKLEILGSCPTCESLFYDRISQALEMAGLGGQVQVEHIKAVENLDAILATPGIDTIMIGPYDLSGSMGLLGQVTHPKVTAVVERVVARAVEASVPVGLAGCPMDAMAGWLDKGVCWLSVGGDYGLLYAAAKAALDEARAIARGRSEG